MGEKRGNTGKLKYDFNTAWVCEVEMQGKWYRVIERDFRSYNGPRRLTRPNPPVLGNVHVGNETFDYEGSRAVIFDDLDGEQVEALKDCIELALTYHQRK